MARAIKAEKTSEEPEFEIMQLGLNTKGRTQQTKEMPERTVCLTHGYPSVNLPIKTVRDFLFRSEIILEFRDPNNRNILFAEMRLVVPDKLSKQLVKGDSQGKSHQ